jgi:hypothetical protein
MRRVLIVNQFRGLGDLLFCVPLLRTYFEKGYKIIQPVVPEYVACAKHFPEFTWVDKSLININYDSKDFVKTDYHEVLPMRFSDTIARKPYREVMRSKYDMMNMDYRIWQQLTWVRDIEAEQRLFDSFNINEPYILVNDVFRTDKTGSVSINPQTDKRIIRMSVMPGYTLLDWLLLMQRADEIHTVGTSINYIIDVPFAEVNCPVHLYVRRPDESNFDNYNYLLERGNYIFHN